MAFPLFWIPVFFAGVKDYDKPPGTRDSGRFTGRKWISSSWMNVWSAVLLSCRAPQLKFNGLLGQFWSGDIYSPNKCHWPSPDPYVPTFVPTEGTNIWHVYFNFWSYGTIVLVCIWMSFKSSCVRQCSSVQSWNDGVMWVQMSSMD